jgi:hypothetical protein
VVSVHRRRKIVTNDFLGRLLFTAIYFYFCYKPCFIKAYLFLLQGVFRLKAYLFLLQAVFRLKAV